MRTIGEQKWQQPWLTQWGDKKLGSSPFQPSRVGEREGARGDGLSGSGTGEQRRCNERATEEKRRNVRWLGWPTNLHHLWEKKRDCFAPAVYFRHGGGPAKEAAYDQIAFDWQRNCPAEVKRPQNRLALFTRIFARTRLHRRRRWRCYRR